MKNLEQVTKWPGWEIREERLVGIHEVPIDECEFILAGEAEIAARLDIDVARAEGYRQGVEDAKCKASIDNATSALHKAQLEYAMKRPDWKSEAMDWMSVFNYITGGAFRGARGIARAEIRQRLERMNRNDNV